MTRSVLRWGCGALVCLLALGALGARIARPAEARLQPPGCASFVEQAKLPMPEGRSNANYGEVMAISGQTLVVGASWDTVGNNSRQGAVYVFVRSGATWGLRQKLTAPDGAFDDRFGAAVAISGDTILVGAPLDDVGGRANQGSAYVFMQNGATWSFQQQLTASDGSFFDSFGQRVALENDTAILAAPGQTAQRVYAFARTGGTWIQTQRINPPPSEFAEGFGSDLAISGTTIAIGASGAQIVPNQAQGAAFIYVFSGADWVLQQKVFAVDGSANDYFGSTLSLSGNTLVAGVRADTIGANQAQGSAYVFVRSGATWSLQQKLMDSDGKTGDAFGDKVAIVNDRIAISASGVYLPPSGTGAIFIYQRTGATWAKIQQMVTSDGGGGVSLAFDGNLASVGMSETVYVFACSSCPVLTLSPQTLPIGRISEPYEPRQFTASGGAGPYAFSVVRGSLPAGMALSPEGLLSGTPTATGYFLFTVQAADVNGCYGRQRYAIIIHPQCLPSSLVPDTLPAGFVGISYNGFLTLTGVYSIQTVSVVQGSLPPGLSLSVGGRDISFGGAPSTAGAYDFTLQVIDSAACEKTQSYRVTINPPCPSIQITPDALSHGRVGRPYSQQITQSGAALPVVWEVLGLPPGFTFDPATGFLTGVPTVAAGYDIQVTVRDANGCSGRKSYSLVFIPEGMQFYPLARPIRLLDTRAGFVACDSPGAQIPAYAPQTQTIGGRTCGGLTIPATARAITGNVTTVQSGGGNLRLYPSDSSTLPYVANSNYNPNQIINNVFTVGLGASDGAFKIFVISNTDVVIDVTGYYAPPGQDGLYFHPLPRPVRLLDTRAGFAACYTPGAALPGATETTQAATGACGGLTIPAAARAIVGNATTVDPEGTGYQYFTLFPADAARPTVASSNYLSGEVMNGPFTVGLSPGGAFKIYPTSRTHLVIDVAGYFSAEATDVNGPGLLYQPFRQPVRLLDTRPTALRACYMTAQPLAAGSTRTQIARGFCDGAFVYSTAVTIIGNATVVGPEAPGWLTFWSNDAAKPTAAASNYGVGQVLNRYFISGLSAADGAFNIYTQATTHLVIDVSGFFEP